MILIKTMILTYSLCWPAQAVGIGQREVSKFLSLTGLSVHNRILGNSWQDIEALICSAKKESCDEIVQQNLDLEILLSHEASQEIEEELLLHKASQEKEESVNTYPKIKVCIDMGWNKKGSGKTYNADSGQHIVLVLKRIKL